MNIFPVPSRICRVGSSCQSSVLSCQSSVLGPQSSVLSRPSLERRGGVIGEARALPSGAGIAKTPIYSALPQSVTKSARPAPRHFKTNHGLRCAKRLRVRWQQPPLFPQFTAIVHLRRPHEKAIPKFPSAFAHFPYGARPESGGCCHRTLRRPAPHRGTSASTLHSGRGNRLPRGRVYWRLKTDDCQLSLRNSNKNLNGHGGSQAHRGLELPAREGDHGRVVTDRVKALNNRKAIH